MTHPEINGDSTSEEVLAVLRDEALWKTASTPEAGNPSVMMLPTRHYHFFLVEAVPEEIMAPIRLEFGEPVCVSALAELFLLGSQHEDLESLTDHCSPIAKKILEAILDQCDRG